MAEDGQSPAMLAPPAVTALKAEAAPDGQDRTHMARSISMDIREEREDLKRAAEQSVNAIIELKMDGQVKWVSPTWLELTGMPASDLVGKDISDIVVGNPDVFANAVDAMHTDDSKSRIIRFSVRDPLAQKRDETWSIDEKTPVAASPTFTALPSPEIRDLTSANVLEAAAEVSQQEEQAANKEEDDLLIELEAQGIMVYDRETGEESHTMWMVKPALSRQVTIDLPPLLAEALGVGAEILANYLTKLTESGVIDPGSHPPPMPVLCRICERQITPWWFERHTELCAQDHRAEMEVQMAQETLNEQRSAIVRVLDALEAQQQLLRSGASSGSESGSPTPPARPEYKGLPIGSTSNPPSNPSSGRASPSANVPRSRDSSSSGLSHHRARSFAVRRPLARIVELVLDLCDTAMEISTPSLKESKAATTGEIRTQSPQSESRIQQVLGWQSPSATTMENEQGLAMLCDDTFRLAKAKIEAVYRHRRILEYSERIRVEHEILVAECIDAAVDKAERVRAGELSDSGDDEESFETTPEQQTEPEEDTTKVPPEQVQHEAPIAPAPQRHSGLPSAMAMALRNVSDQALDRRTSSAGSSRASSPRGSATPKNIGPMSEQLGPVHRYSIAESDTGAESDASMHSSVASITHRRLDSPGGDGSLSRVSSRRSRGTERFREQLKLPNTASTSTNRQPSPGRVSNPPGSPLRMTKPRLPSNADSLPSPITSPLLPHSEFPSPIVRAQHKNHHRRQSSAALAEAMGRPGSPRLNAVSSAQPRASQTSIKDFEIIKPISRGAFGSVYLGKKRNTGEYYAIKALKKADMVAKNQVTNVKAERAIMMWQGESDFVAKLYWTFASKDYLYLVMEYLNGGDCASLIKVLGALPEDWTKKYIAEVVLCVQHLHSRQIVHRDLKPDNLLIDAKGHLKLTDFGLSRMGLIGRQKRAMNAQPDDAPPDLLKTGPFRREPSVGSSRSTSFDYHNTHSPAQTPAMIPAQGNDLNQPSYFTLNRESSTSREPSRRASGHRSDSGDTEGLAAAMFRRFSLADGRTPIEEENPSEDDRESPDPYALHHVISNTSAQRTGTPPQSSMLPPVMSLFDPQDSNRRFVGTPDYLAPETINGNGQDEMSDWWSLGCILFECLYGRPPFNAETPEEVFQNILSRNIHWPDEDEDMGVSADAKDLINKLICLDPKERLGSNKEEKYVDGGEEIKAHPWFAEINWKTLREDEASFIPMNENPEDTEYFDARGATMQNFAAEFEDQQSSPGITPGADYPERPHDALSRVRSQINQSAKRNLMPLHIPPHVRDSRSRRLSEPAVADDFGNFQFKNLPVLEKANKDVIQKLRSETLQAQAKSAQAASAASSAVVSPSPAPSLEASPILPMPLKRALSQTRAGNRPQSPSLLSQAESSPNRGSHPSSPLLVSFSAGQTHERRKTSSGSSTLSHSTSNPTAHSNSLQPGNFFEQAPRLPISFKTPSNTPSPIKGPKSGAMQLPAVTDPAGPAQRQGSASSPRQRSHTVGSQEGDLVPELVPAHHKRRSGVFDISPSSSDTEETRQKALLRVQRRRASSRRLSQVSLMDGPTFRTLDVLVCEDHPVSRLVMERLLEKLRCRTISVNNGSEAIRYAMSEVKFDIIMMEYKLPHLNGTDVARMIRDTKNANSNTPIVAVTGYLKELQAPHHFDALVEKPPTKEKLEEVMGRLCQWKTAPEGWKPSHPQPIPHSSLRQESMPTDDSPTTTTSSSFGGFGTAMSSSYVGSSRGDSIGSSQLSSLGEMDSQFESIPVIISRQATNTEFDVADLERNFGGLGISNTVTSEPKSIQPPSLLTQTSAPSSPHFQDPPVPRRQPSMEAMEAKRRSLEQLRLESAAESGDDEDEELGNIHLRTHSPRRSAKRASKLGTEMMRTNSQGSVISYDEVSPGHQRAEGVLGEKTDNLVGKEHTIAEEPADVVERQGRLTPPVVFPQEPGSMACELVGMEGDAKGLVVSPEPMDMELEGDADPEATPRPPHQLERQTTHDPDPTPRAGGSPQHVD